MTKEKLQKIILEHVQYNLSLCEKNKDIIELYDEYTKRITELFDFIMKKNSNLFYTIVFAILVEIGFFSADRKFDCDKDDFKELSIKPGLSIISGAGVCRNVACFYDDVFNKLYEYPLKLCCLDTQAIVNDDTKTYGNHVINLTIYRDSIYGFDVMNHCLFKAKDQNSLSGLGFDYTLEYMPNGDLLIELTTSLNKKIDFLHTVKLKHVLLEISSMRNVLSVERYEKMVDNANAFLDEKRKLLRSFLLENEELTHEIKKKMLLLK